MIAPTNFTEELNLYLYVSAQVQKEFLGTMKQLKEHALARASSPEGPVPPAEIERELHGYCCMSLKEKFPKKAYYQKLCTNPPFGGEFDDGHGVIVPFPEP